MKRRLLIDDQRNNDAHVIARTAKDGIAALKYLGPWDVLLLDHDLGAIEDNGTGMDVVRFLEENTQYLPKEIVLVTANPAGRDNMLALLKYMKVEVFY